MTVDRMEPSSRKDRSARKAGGRRVCLWLLLGLILSTVFLTATSGTGTAQAIDVRVRVTIQRVRALDNFGTWITPEAADFYAVVEIDGTEFDNKAANDPWEDDDDISPNWEFSRSIDISRGSIPVKIQIYDEDGFLRGDDDPADLDPGAGRDLVLVVNLVPCSVSGDVTGSCGATLTSSGTEDDSAQIWFRIDVVEPPSAPGLNVRCIHDPIWPQSTDTVTITARSLDGALAPRIAQNIEIWVNSTTVPAVTGAGIRLTHSAGPFAGPTFAYGCRVQDDGLTVWTGWRVVSIGTPGTERAVPILFTGPRSSRIDILFIADRDNYTDPSDPAFLTDVASVIEDAYYQGDTNFRQDQDIFLRNQDKFNFWIARDMGDAEAVQLGLFPDCPHDPPDMDNYPFADVGAMLHTDFFRDCAMGGERVFSSEPDSTLTVLHETGHRPFGLADEYCCDGGYFQADPHPNVYEEPEDCAADAPNLGRTAADCREFEEIIEWWFDYDWSVSDPAGDDLMEDSGNHTPRAADIRRIQWMFDRCAKAWC